MSFKSVIVAFHGKLCTSSGIKPGIKFDFKANLRFQSPSKFSIEKCERERRDDEAVRLSFAARFFDRPKWRKEGCGVRCFRRASMLPCTSNAKC